MNTETTRIEIAKEAWGDVPAWIDLLVDACDEAQSQGKVAKRLGYSSSVISQTLRNTYKGDIAALASRVKAVYAPSEFECPALGMINSETCMGWRAKAVRLSLSATFIDVRMHGACRKCPRYTEDG